MGMESLKVPALGHWVDGKGLMPRQLAVDTRIDVLALHNQRFDRASFLLIPSAS